MKIFVDQMPKSCHSCPFKISEDGDWSHCALSEVCTETAIGRDENCPLELIDAPPH